MEVVSAGSLKRTLPLSTHKRGPQQIKAYDVGRGCEGLRKRLERSERLPQVPPLLGGAKRPAIFQAGVRGEGSVR